MKKLYSAVLSLSVCCFNRGNVIKGIVVLMMVVGCEAGMGQIKYWDGGGGDGLWTTASNWDLDVLPVAGDQVVLDNLHGVGVAYDVTLPGGISLTQVLQLTITPLNPLNPIRLILPVGNTANPGFRATGGAGTDDIIINDGGVFINSSGATSGSGVAISAFSKYIRINNGGKFIHNTSTITAGGVASNLSTVAGTENGIFEYDVPGTAPYPISASATNYGSLWLTRTAGAAIYTASGGSPLSVAGNLNINSGITFTSSMTAPFNLKGDLVNNGVAATIPAASAMNFTGAGAQTISGSGATSFSGPTTIASTSTLSLALATSATTISFTGAVTANGNFKIMQGLMSGNGIWRYAANRTLTFANINAAAYPATVANKLNIWWPVTNGPANITMNGTAGNGGITLDAGRTITGTLDLTRGIINNSIELTLDAGAAATSANNSSYVNGKLKKIGNTDFVFPVGKTIGSTTSLVPIEISNLLGSVATDSYTAEYIRASAYTLGPIDPSLIVPLTDVSHLDYWTLDRTVGTGLASANIRAHWTAQSSNGGSAAFIVDPAKVVLAQLVSGKWTNFGNLGTGVGLALAGTVDWTTWTNGTGGSTSNYFSLASTDLINPLPVTVSYLQGAKQNIGNLINWKVSCISNLNATMILQRSTDNRNFTDITSITATAARCQQPFDYTDIAPASGTNYYRLKTINDDGKITYSFVIVIVNKATGFDMVSLLPTLVSSNALLNISSAQKTSLQVVITDAMGRPVQKTAYALIAGSNQFEISVANLSAGMYRITGTTAEGLIKTIAFVKQ